MIHVLQCEDAFDDGKKAEIKKVLKKDKLGQDLACLLHREAVLEKAKEKNHKENE